ncbi:porin family protein [Sphingomonas populi]|uniref:Porin family protein n=1 Tax=Sphingomonas populi TaxID=2484750 RepID=A0A4Q6XVW3_9SPHN|nr:outer membrane beta-barrel protein [Sphingomonas populi]RZF64510.1 porin family protein [Sphingomonas populi]
MRKAFLSAVALGLATFGAQAATAQDTTVTDTATQDTSSDGASTFRGFRIEGNAGGDRFQSQGRHRDKFGYGATVGFDGVIGDKIVVGPEASYWRANDWSEICGGGARGGTICQKSFEEWGAGVRAGYLVTPTFLVYGKGGYVNNEQRKSFSAPAGQTSFYDHYSTDGYQVGGGVEYSLGKDVMKMPLFVGAQYVFSQYNDHTSRQRVMGTIGFHFK